MLAGIKKIFSSLIGVFRKNKPESTQIVGSVPVGETVPGSREFVSIVKRILSPITIEADTPADQLLKKIKEILSRTENELSKEDYEVVRELLQTEFKIPMISAQRLPSGYVVSSIVLKNLDQKICPYTGRAFKPEDALPDDLISILSIFFFNESEVAAAILNDRCGIQNVLERISENGNGYPNEVVHYARDMQKSIKVDEYENRIVFYRNLYVYLRSLMSRVFIIYPIIFNSSLNLLFYYLEHFFSKKAYHTGADDFKDYEKFCEFPHPHTIICWLPNQIEKHTEIPLRYGSAPDLIDEDIKGIFAFQYHPSIYLGILGIVGSLFIRSHWKKITYTVGCSAPLSLLFFWNYKSLKMLAFVMGFTEKLCQEKNGYNHVYFEKNDVKIKAECWHKISYSSLKSEFFEKTHDSWLPGLLIAAMAINLAPFFLIYIAKSIKEKMIYIHDNIPRVLADNLLKINRNESGSFASRFYSFFKWGDASSEKQKATHTKLKIS